MTFFHVLRFSLIFLLFAHFHCIFLTFLHILMFSAVSFVYGAFSMVFIFVVVTFFYSTWFFELCKLLFHLFMVAYFIFFLLLYLCLELLFYQGISSFHFSSIMSICLISFQLLCGGVFLVTVFCLLFVFLFLSSFVLSYVHINLMLITFDSCLAMNEEVPPGPAIDRRLLWEKPGTVQASKKFPCFVVKFLLTKGCRWMRSLFLLFLNSFIEVQFPYYCINSFNQYFSLAWRDQQLWGYLQCKTCLSPSTLSTQQIEPVCKIPCLASIFSLACSWYKPKSRKAPSVGIHTSLLFQRTVYLLQLCRLL